MRQRHIEGADGLRGLACLIVLVIHACVIIAPATFPVLAGHARIGVWLFFALSAYLLTHQLLLRGLSRATLADYFIGRTLRIYPLFALTVGLCYLVGSAGVDTPADVWRALTFQQGYAHLWTIPVEFKFYFLLPVIVFAGSMVQARIGNRGLALVAVLAVLLHQWVAPVWLAQYKSIATFQYLPIFLVGALAAFLEWRSLRMFSGRLLTKLGHWSYSTYLLHYLIVQKIALAFPGSVVAVGVALVVSIAAGAALYALAEKPIFALRHRVTRPVWITAPA